MAKESNFKNMTICLSAICLVASALLSIVYVITKEPIEKSAREKTNSAISEVVPEFDNTPSEEMFTVDMDGVPVKVYPARKGKETVGYAVESFTTKGFGGRITVMVGFTSDGKICSTSVISHSETPGLGDKINKNKSGFSLQFDGKDPKEFKLAVKKDGGDVDAITASTVTSRAYCDAMQFAYRVFEKIEEGGKANE